MPGPSVLLLRGKRIKHDSVFTCRTARTLCTGTPTWSSSKSKIKKEKKRPRLGSNLKLLLCQKKKQSTMLYPALVVQVKLLVVVHPKSDYCRILRKLLVSW
jgi:hypothetical protein